MAFVEANLMPESPLICDSFLRGELCAISHGGPSYFLPWGIATMAMAAGQCCVTMAMRRGQAA